ncbi:MAG: NAD(P)/FAD-dependent oxidoreductase [Dermatophilaceae bacterium]
MSSAVVVGSGPNGLTAAAVLAVAGVAVTVIEAADEVGGGARSGEAIIPGLLHDHCSAIHPMVVSSPVVHSLDLASYGLRWRFADVDCAHPLDDGTAVALFTDVEHTAMNLGPDARAWRALFGVTSRRYNLLAEDVLAPVLHVPRHPALLARFGMPALLPASVLVHAFRAEPARALFGGVAAHAFRPFSEPMSSAIGLGILTAGHRDGWAIPEGGSASIIRALRAVVEAHGGVIETGTTVRSAADLPLCDVVMFDLAPPAVADILGPSMPVRVARAYRRFQRGPGAFKLDLAVEGGVPWTAPVASRAGVVHVGGTFEQIEAAEREVVGGRMPARPFILVGQQYLADPLRSVHSVHPVWTYAHVPHGYSGNASEAILTQLERFAPGVRERIVGMHVTTPADFAAGNANFVGGDILTGAKNSLQLVFGPRLGGSPYDTGVPGMYLCSAATPPGPGAHGMCGANAASRALAYLNEGR